MINPKLIFQGNPLANWRKLLHPIIERAVQVLIASWIIILAAASAVLVFIVLRLLWVGLKLFESLI